MIAQGFALRTCMAFLLQCWLICPGTFRAYFWGLWEKEQGRPQLACGRRAHTWATILGGARLASMLAGCRSVPPASFRHDGCWETSCGCPLALVGVLWGRRPLKIGDRESRRHVVVVRRAAGAIGAAVLSTRAVAFASRWSRSPSAIGPCSGPGGTFVGLLGQPGRSTWPQVELGRLLILWAAQCQRTCSADIGALHINIMRRWRLRGTSTTRHHCQGGVGVQQPGPFTRMCRRRSPIRTGSYELSAVLWFIFPLVRIILVIS